MARKIEDMICVVTLTDEAGSPITTPEAAAEREAEFRQTLRATFGSDVAVEVKTKTFYRCEHCRSLWVEESPDYNGGCCADDEANAPTEQKANAA